MFKNHKRGGSNAIGTEEDQLQKWGRDRANLLAEFNVVELYPSIRRGAIANILEWKLTSAASLTTGTCSTLAFPVFKTRIATIVWVTLCDPVLWSPAINKRPVPTCL